MANLQIFLERVVKPLEKEIDLQLAIDRHKEAARQLAFIIDVMEHISAVATCADIDQNDVATFVSHKERLTEELNKIIDSYNQLAENINENPLVLPDITLFTDLQQVNEGR